MNRGGRRTPPPPPFFFSTIMSKEKLTFEKLPLHKLLELQGDLDIFLAKYALTPTLERVRLAILAVYPSLLEAIQQKKVEAEENKAIQQQALADAEAEELADEGRLFWLSANDLHAGQINIGQQLLTRID